jgi:hypothetical protein
VNGSRFDQLLTDTLRSLIDEIIYHMPDSAYKEMLLWSISLNNPDQGEWLRVLGLFQLSYLGHVLFDDLITDSDDWEALSSYLGPLSAYLVFETMSDDLALGLSRRDPSDTGYLARRQLLYVFNEMMTQRLSGSTVHSADLLESVRPLADQVSVFNQKLTPDFHRQMAANYIQASSGATVEALEYSIYPCLVANIEGALALVRSAAASHTAPLLIKGLLNRYRGVNSLLRSDSIPLARLADIGANTILVVPTLAYCVTAWAETLHPLPGIQESIASGTLYEVLYTGAMLSRLLNDLGGLLSLHCDERRELIAQLQHSAYRADSFAEVLLDAAHSSGGLLTRLEKDITFGEFNMCLHGISDAHEPLQALSIFSERLEYYSSLYTQCWSRFADSRDRLNCELGDETVSDMVGRFVTFHDHLYRMPHSEPSGEYTV